MTLCVSALNSRARFAQRVSLLLWGMFCSLSGRVPQSCCGSSHDPKAQTESSSRFPAQLMSVLEPVEGTGRLSGAGVYVGAVRVQLALSISVTPCICVICAGVLRQTSELERVPTLCLFFSLCCF